MTNIVRLGDTDNVATAIQELSPGDMLELDTGETVIVEEEIPFGHKVALAPLTSGDDVVKYDKQIGTVTEAINAGGHVHIHNVESNYGRGDRDEATV